MNLRSFFSRLQVAQLWERHQVSTIEQALDLRDKDIYYLQGIGKKKMEAWQALRIQLNSPESVTPATEREKFEARLLEVIEDNSILTARRNEKLAKVILAFLETEAQEVEHLFNPDNEDGLKAVPLLWTKDK